MKLINFIKYISATQTLNRCFVVAGEKMKERLMATLPSADIVRGDGKNIRGFEA